MDESNVPSVRPMAGRGVMTHANGCTRATGPDTPLPGTVGRCRARAWCVGRAQARPADFWVLRVIESMTTVASSTPPVIMYWIGVAMP